MDSSQLPPSELPSESVDDLFAVLSNEACRHVVQYFQQATSSVTDFDSLVDYSVKLADESVDREQRAIVLHHIALPKLADVGVLVYDVQSNTVEYHGHPAADQLIGQTTHLEESQGPDGDQTGEIIDHLEDALQVEDSDLKNFHIREALQYLNFGPEVANGSDYG